MRGYLMDEFISSGIQVRLLLFHIADPLSPTAQDAKIARFPMSENPAITTHGNNPPEIMNTNGPCHTNPGASQTGNPPEAAAITLGHTKTACHACLRNRMFEEQGSGCR